MTSKRAKTSERLEIGRCATLAASCKHSYHRTILQPRRRTYIHAIESNLNEYRLDLEICIALPRVLQKRCVLAHIHAHSVSEQSNAVDASLCLCLSVCIYMYEDVCITTHQAHMEHNHKRMSTKTIMHTDYGRSCW